MREKSFLKVGHILSVPCQSPLDLMATYILVKLLVVALFALGASVHANDGNPCRHIEIFDPYVGGNVIFDLSSLIAQYVPVQ